jgi:Lrp/AsnC family transcriptional regulator
MKLDRIDLKILDLLQQDATVPVARIADQVGLTQTPCWKRIQKHQESGVIRKRVALLDPDLLGLSLTAFVLIEAADQSAEWRHSFMETVEQLESIRDIYRVAGSYDYLLRVVVRDMPAFEAFQKTLSESVPMRSVNAIFAMESVKVDPSIPLPSPALFANVA